MHIHSTASDGSMRPSELVRHAKENGLAAVALTDHDTVDGIKEALEEGERIGLEVVSRCGICLYCKSKYEYSYNVYGHLGDFPVQTADICDLIPR